MIQGLIELGVLAEQSQRKYHDEISIRNNSTSVMLQNTILNYHISKLSLGLHNQPKYYYMGRQISCLRSFPGTGQIYQQIRGRSVFFFVSSSFSYVFVKSLMLFASGCMNPRCNHFSVMNPCCNHFVEGLYRFTAVVACWYTE